MWHRLCGVEWLKSLTIDFEHVATLWIKNLNSTMRGDCLYNIWSWPPGFSLPGKRWSLELYNRIFYLRTKFFLWMDLSWKSLVLCLEIRTLLYASFLNFFGSKICNFLKSSTFFKSKFNCFIAHIARCSSSTGKWQGFPNITRYGDIPRTVL